MDTDPRYEVENAEIKALLTEIGRVLATQCPPGWGFCLQLFEFDGSSFFYISNAQRETMLMALREFLNREQ